MSILSFDPHGPGGVSTFGADPTPNGRRRDAAASGRLVGLAVTSATRNPVGIPVPQLGDPDGSELGTPKTRGRTLERSNSSPSPSPSPSSSRSPYRLRRALSASGRVVGGVGLFATAVATGGLALPIAAAVTTVALARQAKPHAPATPASLPASPSEPAEVFPTPGFSEPEAALADPAAPPAARSGTDDSNATNTCKPVTDADAQIKAGNETLQGIIQGMQVRITQHEEISLRVQNMQSELARLKAAAKSMPKPTTPEGIAQHDLATAAINTCSSNMVGMENAVTELVATIEELKKQIESYSEDDLYDLTKPAR
jgi:hypothetical protein